MVRKSDGDFALRPREAPMAFLSAISALSVAMRQSQLRGRLAMGHNDWVCWNVIVPVARKEGSPQAQRH
jgi:hypothetical protein